MKTTSRSRQNLDELHSQLTAIHHQLEKQNSLLHAFLRGVMTGLGATVGLTLVIALLAFAISYLANLLGQQSTGQTLIEILR